MSASTEIAAAMTEVAAVFGQTITISGTSYACSASSFSHTKTWEDEGGGSITEFDLSVSIRRSLFSGSIPTEGLAATFSSNTFRIQRVIEAPGSTFIRLLCISEPNGI